jgi:hypothetical protein
MQDRVSKQHTNAPANRRIVIRNSESEGEHSAAHLLPVWPKDLHDRTLAGRRKLISVIERELRKERRRGIAGDRAYDVARHAKLVRFLREEREAFLMLACAGLGDTARAMQRGSL